MLVNWKSRYGACTTSVLHACISTQNDVRSLRETSMELLARHTVGLDALVWQRYADVNFDRYERILKVGIQLIRQSILLVLYPLRPLGIAPFGHRHVGRRLQEELHSDSPHHLILNSCRIVGQFEIVNEGTRV